MDAEGVALHLEFQGKKNKVCFVGKSFVIGWPATRQSGLREEATPSLFIFFHIDPY